jgi:hypothetical protein
VGRYRESTSDNPRDPRGIQGVHFAPKQGENPRILFVPPARRGFKDPEAPLFGFKRGQAGWVGYVRQKSQSFLTSYPALSRLFSFPLHFFGTSVGIISSFYTPLP